MKRKKIKQRRRKCSDCGRIFVNAGARATHWAKVHYVKPPPPPPPPKMELVSFKDLVSKTTWGKKQPDGKWGVPTENELMLGYLALISEQLGDILQELKRPKKIL